MSRHERAAPLMQPRDERDVQVGLNAVDRKAGTVPSSSNSQSISRDVRVDIKGVTRPAGRNSISSAKNAIAERIQQRAHKAVNTETDKRVNRDAERNCVDEGEHEQVGQHGRVSRPAPGVVA